MTAQHSRFGLITKGEGSRRFTRSQKIVCLAVVAVVVVTTTLFAVVGQPSIAVQPKPFGGSLALNDVQDPVVIDLATGSPTLRLQGIESQVGATDPSLVDAVPLSDGTLLVNRDSGTFNVLGLGNSIVKSTGGVGLGDFAGSTEAAGFAAGDDGYIVRYAPAAATISLADQATVVAAAQLGASASGRNAMVPLLGSAQLHSAIPTDPGATATADGDLWTITRDHGRGTLRRYAPGTPGKALVASAFGSVGSIGALATGRDGGVDVVALAEPSGIRILQPAGHGGSRPQARTVPVRAGRGVDRIVPVGNGDGQVLFAYHSDQGWHLVSVDLATDQGASVHAITGVPARDNLESPVIDGGVVYAIADDGSETPPLVTIDARTGAGAPLAGVGAYPVAGAAERTAFVDPGLPPQVIAVGPRVIINNPNRVLAVVVFTDGSRATRVVDKRTAIEVNPAALPGATVSGPSPTAPASSQAATPQPQQVDAQLRCQTSTQKPRVPVLAQPVPAARSVALSWTYTLLDNEDCEPTSYLVTVAVVGSGPTPPTTQFPVNGQTAFNVTGLRPNTTYSFTVTAFINTQSTPSLPRQATTNPEGPDAPTGVSTVANGSTGWTVTWNVCQGDACDSNLPATTWTVTGSTCGGGSEFIGTPPVVSVAGTGEATQRTTVSFAQFPSLVGDQLTFSVQGTSATGLTGGSASDGQCTEGWRPADAGAFTVTGAATPSGNAVSATLTVQPNPGESVAQAFGSESNQFTFSVLSGGQQVGQAISGTNQMTATFAGLSPGQVYTPQVVVKPLVSPTSGTAVQGAPFSQTVPWPAGITATQASQSVTPGDPNTGSATFTLTNVFAGPATAVTAPYTLVCGSNSVAPGGIPTVTPAGGSSGTVTIPMDYTQVGSGCTATFTLQDSPGGPYGALTDQLAPAAVTPAPPLGVTAGDYVVTNPVLFGTATTTSVYAGGGGTDWQLVVAAAGQPGCTESSGTPGGTGGPWIPTALVFPSCPGASTFTVSVTYFYAGTETTIAIGTANAPTTPAPPTVTRIDPATGPAGATVTITGTNLAQANQVNFGPVAADPSTIHVSPDGTSLTVTVPAGTGTVPVTVATPGGTSAPGLLPVDFTYTTTTSTT